MKRANSKVPRRRIAWDRDQVVRRVGRFAEFGVCAATIGGKTRLTHGQLYYRLKRMGIRIRDFREGHGPLFQRVLKEFSGEADVEVEKRIRPLTLPVRYLDRAA